MEKQPYEQHCSLMRFVSIFSGKWIFPILYHLIETDQAVRFNQLHKALYPIPQKELSKQLKLLEKHLLIEKTIFAEIPPRVEYRVTDLGKSLKPSLQHLSEWMCFYEASKAEIDSSQF